MYKIAKEKENYYSIIKDEIKKKYKNKVLAKMLYEEKKGDEWTHYMSIKRKRLKKNTAIVNKINRLTASSSEKELEKKNKQIRKLEMLENKKNAKAMKQSLGLKSSKTT
jgi:hypothetical protein